MPDEPAFTYEATGPGVVLLGRHESLAASSAALPHGAYTTLRTYGGRRVLRLDRHLTRLDESVALEGESGTVDVGAARAAITAVLDATSCPESRLRLTFAPPRLFVAIEPFQPLPPADYQNGVACVTLDLRRKNPRAKDTRFIATARAAYRRLPAGIAEGLLVEDGAILEGLSSNFFAFLDGALCTEPDRVIAGVTRSLVLDVAREQMLIATRAVRKDELARVSEAFITSVSREVLPVVRIDAQPVGDGRVGSNTRAVIEGFARLAAQEAEAL
jgi:branched-chain amino acid aminotransferase